MSSYAWAQFPYDNLCDPDVHDGPAVDGEYQNVELLSGDIIPSVTVTQTTPVVYCSQSWRNVGGLSFPQTSRIQPDGRSWMSGEQETLTDIYGWTTVGVLALFVVYYFGSAILNFCLSWFRGVYAPRGQNQFIDFSSNPEIFAYVPQIKLIGFPFPFLACDIGTPFRASARWSLPLILL